MSNLGMDQEENHSQKGVWFVLLAAILFGLSTPIAKGLLREISPQILAGLFYLSSGIGLMLVRWLLRKRTSLIEAPLSRRDVPWLSGAVVFGGVLAPLLLLSGLLQTPASNASLLLNLEGVLTVVLAQVALHENLNRRAGAGVTAILVGGNHSQLEEHPLGH